MTTVRPQTRQKSSPVSVKHWLSVIKKRGRFVFLCALSIVVLGTVITSLLPDVYRATITILVDPRKIPETYVSSTVTTDPNARMDTLTQQVLSASRLQEIIDLYDLYPELRRKKGLEDVIEYMRGKTTIALKQSPDSDQGLSSFSISYEDRDRALVGKITNALAASVIDSNLKVRQQQALGTTQFLSGELQQAKERLETQERQLEAFKLRHAGGTPDELTGNLQALQRLQSETQATMDTVGRLEEERMLLAQVKPMEAQAPPVTERGRLLEQRRHLESERMALKRQFTDQYPEVIAVDQQLKDVNARLASMPGGGDADGYDPNTRLRLSLIDKELKQNKQRVAELQQKMQSYQGKVDSVPVVETQLVELTRNYEVSKKNYQSLLDKTFAAGMSEELERKQQAERFTVLDPAKTPEKPVRPQRLLILLGVFAGALILPSAAVVGLEMMKGSVQCEEELKDMLPIGVAILGMIPPIESKDDKRRARVMKAQMVAVSVVAVAALSIFLFFARPVL